ncbi:hypothetical protein Dthio_PD2401 [Desulfonatronospira thiodismutans ASO3-1]|uniref:Uncharacterized protein n=1 Tax=Desulfonatronospira thiodismutans ASO3-1 TaxID=555779 RepID=D6SQI3_9BACT|nr:hypothetical protein [Desulfonatronospira thiodismutans]EFI35009.1 hypothetical protein Dthio_PD2401 [Desulfonatronospira thiodismutans ASO3-1]
MQYKKFELSIVPGEPFKANLPDFEYMLFDCIQEDLNVYDLEPQ